MRRPESQLAQLGSLYPFQSEGEEDRDRPMVEDVSFPGHVSFGALDFPLTARCCFWSAGPCPVVVRGDGRSVVACVGLVRWWAQRSWHVSTGPCEVRTPPTIRTHPPGRISLVKDAVGVSSKSLVIY